MAAPRSPRTRSSGGRTLMLLGIVLALASAVLVIYILSQATASYGQTEQLVVATQNIGSGVVFNTDADVQKYFAVKTFPVALVPSGAYVYTTFDDLKVQLENHIVVTPLFPGDVLLANDQRIAKVGSANAGSLININPGALTAGDVLFALKFDNPLGGASSFVVAGDHIDILATECNLPNVSGCATQTVFQNIAVYATFQNAIILAVDPHTAEELKYLVETGKIDLAIRQANDTSNNHTAPVNASTIAALFS